MAFKTPWSSKVLHVAWKGQFWTPTYGLMEHVWIVSADSEYGTLVPSRAPQWRVIQSSKAKAGEPGNNPAWAAGERVKSRSGSLRYEILATADKCVLVRDVTNHDSIYALSNVELEKYYTREK